MEGQPGWCVVASVVCGVVCPRVVCGVMCHTACHGDVLIRGVEDIISSYRFPTIKVMDLVRKEGDSTTVLFLSKIKLMGWEATDRMPSILRHTDVEVVLGNSEVSL